MLVARMRTARAAVATVMAEAGLAGWLPKD
jgi:hypothetical protein